MYNRRKFRSKYDVNKAFRKRRDQNLADITQQKIEIDSLKNRKRGQISYDLAECTPKKLAKYGIKHPHRNRYFVYVPSDHPYHKRYRLGGWELRSRLVMMVVLRRMLRPGTEIHHIDHNPTNDRPANLRIKTVAQHQAHHILSNAEKDQIRQVQRIPTEYYEVAKAYEDRNPRLPRLSQEEEVEVTKTAKMMGVSRTKVLAMKIATKMGKNSVQDVLNHLSPNTRKLGQAIYQFPQTNKQKGSFKPPKVIVRKRKKQGVN